MTQTRTSLFKVKSDYMVLFQEYLEKQDVEHDLVTFEMYASSAHAYYSALVDPQTLLSIRLAFDKASVAHMPI